MNRKYNKLIASCASAALLFSGIGSSVPAFATTLENDTAVAGMAVTFNNYYANSHSPEADILDYLSPSVSSTLESEEASAAAVKANVGKQTGTVSGTAAADDLIDDDQQGTEGLVSTTARLFMRKSASLTAPVVAYLYNNCKVEIFDTVTNNDGTWYLVRTDGIEGYVSAQFVLIGNAAQVAETNIQNKYATVTADSLALYDTAASEGRILDYVHKGETYPIMQATGDYVMIKVSDTLWGYVSRDGVTINTQFAQATEIDDEYIKNLLDGYLTEIDDAKRVYDERVATHDYSGAKSAIDYCVELWDEYISTTTDAGMTDLADAAKQQREDAVKLSEKVAQIIEDLRKEAENNVVVPTEPAETSSASSENGAAESQPASSDVPSSDAESVPETPAETTPASTAEAVSVTAYYTGSQKYAGDVISASELYLHVVYSDGSEGDITDPSQWSSPNVGMILPAGEYLVTMYYGELHSSFLLNVLERETQPTQPTQPTETQPTQPAEQPTQPTETQPTQPAEQPTQPTETQPTQPAEQPTQPTETQPTQPVSAVSMEARYTGGQKYAGDVISAAELYIHVVYSDGSEADITDSSQWSCAQVGMILAAGSNTVTITYGALQSSFVLEVAEVPTQPAEQPTQPTETQPVQPETPAPTETQPTEPAPTPAPTPEVSAVRQQMVAYALQWVGQCNYVWAGTNLSVGGGVDCSGFTMRVFESVGVSLPHYSVSQIYCGAQITYDQLRPGDLVYFPNPDHVAIYIGNGQIVHAKNEQSGIVVDSLFYNPNHLPTMYISILP